jgi:ABC-type multidrug transport system fused ATPase/permease subunit
MALNIISFKAFIHQFIGDFLRVYRALSPRLKRRTLRVFLYIFGLAWLEVLNILSISFLALSITAPDRVAESYGFVAGLFHVFPKLADVAVADPRFFSLIASSAVVALTAAKNAMSAFVSLANAHLGEEIALFAGETVFEHYLYSPYIRHLSGDSGKMYQALSWRTHLGSLIINIMMVYTYAAISLGLFLTLITATFEILFLTIFCVAFISAVIYRSIKRNIDNAGINTAEFNRKEVGATMNAMNGIREILIYRQQLVFFEKFEEACQGGAPSRAFQTIAPMIPPWLLEVAGFAVIPVTLWVMFRFYDSSMVQITGVLTMIMLACWRILPLLNRSLSCLVMVRGLRYAAMECLSRVEYAIANPVTMPTEPDPDFVLRNDISFVDVSFKYPSAKEECLHGISFSITHGSCIGIIGQSGAGKSTIVSILSGLIQPATGTLLVDGQSLSPAALAAYTMQVGYVPQTPYIMSGTLAENVAFSQWGKPYDEERVRWACRLAALDVVETRGIALPIGDKGAGLSGGQAQRLSIARALYVNPALLILDEATSSLDSAVEAAIMNTIYDLPKSITTVIIAHRLTTVERCDMLLWIDKGKIVEFGPAAEVLPKYQTYLDRLGGK